MLLWENVNQKVALAMRQEGCETVAEIHQWANKRWSNFGDMFGLIALPIWQEMVEE